jgi:putative methionine-R-sulfoxide reductase with GAF domain
MTTKSTKSRTAGSLASTLVIAFFILTITPLLVSGGLSVYNNYVAYQETISAQQLVIAQDAGKTVATSIEEKFTVLETAAGLGDPISADSETRQATLGSLLGLESAFRQITMLGTTGRQVSQSSRQSSTLSSQFEAQLTADMLAQTQAGQRYIGPVYIDDVTSEPLVVIAVPLQNVFGDFQGTLAAELNLKFMWDLVDQIDVGETGYVYVVDNQGNLIAFEDTARVLRGENVKQIPEVQEFLENLGEVVDITPDAVNYAGLLGNDVVGSYVPLGTPQWAVLTETPTSEAYQPVIQFLIRSVAIILLFAVLGTVAGIFVSRRLSAPLVALSNVATAIGTGNLTLQAKVNGPAEIANVASAFNIMTSRLRDLVDSLEQRIKDRTKAMATSSEVSRRLSTLLDEKELVKEVVNQVRNAFSYYHTQIYFYDEARENLVMAGGTGEAGKMMLAQFHKLAKGRGLVGRAAENNEPILITDTSQSPEWLPNRLLPETRSEVAIPITLGDEVLGVLDVQHNVVDGLKREDIDALQSIANQVAIAVQNARSYTKIQSSQILLSDALRTAKLGNWEYDFKNDFFLFTDEFYAIFRTTAERVGGYKVSSADYSKHFVHPDDAALVGIEIQKVLDSKERHSTTRLEHRIIFADGEVGYIAVNINVDRDADGNLLRWYGANQDITERRSLEEINRKRAAQQEAINQITQKIQGTTSIEAALQVTARELGHALGMKQTTVTLDSARVDDKVSQ